MNINWKKKLMQIHVNILNTRVCWNGPRCPELVAGSGKQVEVVVMPNDVQDMSTMDHVVMVGSVRIGHVISGSHVHMYDFGRYL